MWEIQKHKLYDLVYSRFSPAKRNGKFNQNGKFGQKDKLRDSCTKLMKSRFYADPLYSSAPLLYTSIQHPLVDSYVSYVLLRNKSLSSQLQLRPQFIK